MRRTASSGRGFEVDIIPKVTASKVSVRVVDWLACLTRGSKFSPHGDWPHPAEIWDFGWGLACGKGASLTRGFG